MKVVERASSGKVKYDSLTGKSVIDSTINQFDSYMNKILGINNENYIDTLLSAVTAMKLSSLILQFVVLRQQQKEKTAQYSPAFLTF